MPDGLTKERSAITYEIDACDMNKRAQVQYVEFHPAMRTPEAKQYGVKAARVQATAGVGRLPKMNGKAQRAMTPGKISLAQAKRNWEASVKVSRLIINSVSRLLVPGVREQVSSCLLCD